MSFLDKAKGYANQAKEKADALVEKHGPRAAEGVATAKQRLDKATGGKYHNKIENVSTKVENALNTYGQKKNDGNTKS